MYNFIGLRILEFSSDVHLMLTPWHLLGRRRMQFIAEHQVVSACLYLSFFIICAILRVIYINCNANLISRKCQGTVKEGQGHESNDVVPNDELSRQRHLQEDGDCGTTFYLKLHICSYLICDVMRDADAISRVKTGELHAHVVIAHVIKKNQF